MPDSPHLRALTIKQPWLHAITSGAKTVENRSWPAPASVTGQRIALHASKRYDYRAVFPPGTVTPDWEPGELPEGAVVAVARIAACHPRYHICNPAGPVTVCSPWAEWGQCHWVLDDVTVLAEPVPCRGMLGLWKLPADVEQAVRE